MHARAVRYFSITVIFQDDGRVAFNVDSLDGRPRGFAHALEIRSLDASGTEAGKTTRIRLTPRVTLERTSPPPEIVQVGGMDVTVHGPEQDSDGLSGPREVRDIEWVTDAVTLHPGVWKATVGGGGYMVRTWCAERPRRVLAPLRLPTLPRLRQSPRCRRWPRRQEFNPNRQHEALD
jgi:hypothetical protein